MAEQFIDHIADIVAHHLRAQYTVEEYAKIQAEIQKIVRLSKKTWKDQRQTYSYKELDRLLSGINEKQKIRKVRGVYYTPEDVVRFILNNSALLLYKKAYGTGGLDEKEKKEFASKKTVFDPTCGTGEFLVAALKLKFECAKKTDEEMSREEIRSIVKTVFGNDINEESVVILKLRIFLFLLEKFGIDKLAGISGYLNRQFWTYDYLCEYEKIKKKFDLIIGNPPYVEDKKAKTAAKKRYGNIYANVLIHSGLQLKRNGVMGYIIPLSYSATPRMKELRRDFLETMGVQWLFHFSDRPDCLFTSVHQKLTVLIAKKSKKARKEIYTSNYQYWYKAQREQLFENLKLFRNDWVEERFIPKLGNETEECIYRKIAGCGTSFAKLVKKDEQYPVYVNLRAAFWMKAFLSPHTGGDYRMYGFSGRAWQMYAMCLLNSSLFWWFWVCVSDCWHITAKEFEMFKVPPIFDEKTVEKLAESLETRLEETKVHIGSKQTEYEYKHKSCLEEIDRIDAYIGNLFGLTEKEQGYISQFARKYRVSKGAEDETD